MQILLILTVMVFPFYKILPFVEVGGAEISIYDGLVIILALLLPFAFVKYKHKINLLFFDLIVLLWFCLNGLMLLNDIPDFSAGLNVFRYKIAVPVSFYFLVRVIANDAKIINRLLWGYIISVGIMGGFGLVEFLNTHERIRAAIGGPHAAGVIFSGGLFLGLLLLRQTSNLKRKSIAGLSVLLSGLGAFLTFGRILIPAIILFFLISGYLVKRKVLLNLVMISLIVVSTAFPFAVIQYKGGMKAYNKLRLQESNTRTVTRLENVEQFKAGAGVRTPVYMTATHYFYKSPIWGNGFSIYHQLKQKNLIKLSHAHNLMLDILLRSGLLGWLSFVILLIWFSSRIGRKYTVSEKNAQRIMVAGTALIFVSLSNGVANNIANLASSSAFWFYIALVMNASIPQYLENRL